MLGGSTDDLPFLITKNPVLESHSAFISISEYLAFVLLAVNSQATVFLAFTLVVLLALTFTISGAEVALFSLDRKDINMLKTKDQDSARRIVRLLDEPKEVYASLLIAGTVINIVIIILANHLLTLNISVDPFSSLMRPWNSIVDVLMRAAVIGLMLIFVGKIFPKVWAAQNNLRFAFGTVGVVEVLHLLLSRISRWAVTIADNIGKTAGADKAEALSIREMDEAIDIKSDEEVSQEEKNIMKGIVKFGNISVKQIMKSRLDVSGVDYDCSIAELTKKVEELHYSRLPVYKGSMDTIAGIINTKDLLPHLNEEDFDWHILMRQPYFVPEQKPIEDLLREFQQKRVHFAVVVDEFGGTSGIVTMEDILEEIIGEIKDEFDEEETGNRKLDENNYIFEGKTMIHDVCKQMGLPIDTFDTVKGESDSLAGLVLEQAGEFPEQNAVIPCGDFEFAVLQTDKNRIQQVKVTIKPRIE